MTINSKTKKVFVFLIIFILFMGFSFLTKTSHVFAACDSTGSNDYCLLEPIPLSDDNVVQNKVDITTYIPQAIRLAIALAGALAVIMLIFAGFQYISSEGFGKKSDAKEKIQNALLGLLLVIGSYSILYTINPELLVLNLNIAPIPGGEGLVTERPGTPPPPGPGPGPGPGGYDYETPAAEGGWGPCPNCVTMATLPQKACTPYACMIHQLLYAKLMDLNRLQGDKWQITEAWPPSYKKHIDSCHNPGPEAGTCVDAAIRGGNSVDDIKTFLTNIKRAVVGGSFQYEVSTRERYDLLKNSGKLDGFKIILNTNATGEHVHINYP